MENLLIDVREALIAKKGKVSTEETHILLMRLLLANLQFGQFYKVAKSLKSIEIVGEIQILKQGAVDIEDYESAIDYRDEQTRLKAFILNPKTIEGFFEKVELYNNVPKKRDSNFFNEAWLTKLSTLKGDELVLEAIISKRKVMVETLIEEKVIFNDLNSKVSKSWIIHNTSESLAYFASKLRYVIAQPAFFQLNCLRAKKFIDFFKYSLLNLELYLLYSSETQENWEKQQKDVWRTLRKSIRNLRDQNLESTYERLLSGPELSISKAQKFKLMDKEIKVRGFKKLVEEISKR